MPDKHPLSVRRALVLGGGGPVGGYWEAGFLRGLTERGVARNDFDLMLGTSAGAIVGAQLVSGRQPDSPEETRAQRRARGEADGPRFPVDLSKLDIPTLTRIFALWSAIRPASKGQCAEIGALARSVDRTIAPGWVASFEEGMPTVKWSEQRFHVVTIDAVTGDRRIFDGSDGVPLTHAVAASCAIPGLCPPVELSGGLYMDGGVHSSTNADLLLSNPPEYVLMVVPTNAGTSSSVGAHADSMLEHEVAALRAAGSEVKVVTPSASDVQRLGNDLMNYARIDDAYGIGLDTGRAWATML